MADARKSPAPRMAALAIVVAAIAFVSVQFFAAANDTIKASRVNACRAMAPQPLPAAVADGVAPDFQLPDANGKMWSLAALRGRPVLLNFWATWCPPCVEEMPALENLARQLGNDAVILAVSVDEDWDTVRRFFHQGTPLSVVLDAEKQVPPQYGTDKYPETFLIGRDGRIERFFQNKRQWDAPEAAACVLSLR